MENYTWKPKYNFVIFIFTIFIFWVVFLVYHEKMIDAGYIAGALLAVFIFFYFLRYLEGRWKLLPANLFSRRLVVTSLLIRLAATIGLYYFYQYRTGYPFEFYAVDSVFYHERAKLMADEFSRMNFDINSLTKDLEFSDKGYNIYLGFIYYLFGPQIIVPRLVNVLFSTVTVLLIYKIARQMTDEKTARFAGIMAMLLPNFLLYLGTHLKETLMLFLLVLALYQSVRIIKLGKRQVINLLLLIIPVFLLFTFRTVLGAVTFASFLAYALLFRSYSKKILNISAVVFVGLVFTVILLSSDVGNEMAAYYEKRTNALSDNMQFRAAREGGNKFALLASAPLFLSIIIMAPFPSFVYVFEQDNLWMFLGANFIRNLYAFFVIAGIIYSIRHKWREHSLLLVFVLGYFGVLANSGFAISERFHLPVLPALVIFAATGVGAAKSTRWTKYYPAYLALVALLIIIWNHIKLAGRA